MYTYEDKNDPGSAERKAYAAMETSEVGGGTGYNWPDQPAPSQADATVSSGAEFYSALRDDAVEYVYVPSGAVNISNDSLQVSGPKVIYGDGPSESLLYSNSDGNGHAGPGGSGRGHLYRIYGNVRITGLEIRGWMYNNWPDDRWPGYEPTNVNDGPEYDIQFGEIRSSNVRIDNCNIHGWGTQAIGIYENPEIDHNKIHNCMLTGYGYVSIIYRGQPHFHHNYMNACRHALTSFGYYDSGFITEDNLFGPYWSSHLLDAHSLAHNKSSGMSDDWRDKNWKGNAGGNMVVRNNTFMAWQGFDEPDAAPGLTPYPWPVWAVAIRGYPWPRNADGIIIENNRVMNPITASDVYNAPYRDDTDQTPWTQQLSRGTWTIPDSQIRSSDNYTTNFTIRENLYDAYGLDHDGVHGAPVNLHGKGVPGPTAQLRVYVEDDSTGERINGATVTINKLN